MLSQEGWCDAHDDDLSGYTDAPAESDNMVTHVVLLGEEGEISIEGAMAHRVKKIAKCDEEGRGLQHEL